MQEVREELAVEPRRLSRRARLFACGGTALLGVLLLPGSQSTGCTSPTETPSPSPSARPWLAADDPLVRDLHFAALDRARTSADVAPTDVLASDVRQTTRELGDTGGVVVYLADGPGFSCLGVDGRRAHYDVAKQCLLDVTVANQGLYASIRSDAAAGPARPGRADSVDDAILVVAVPDHASLLTSSSTERLADYTSVVVLRPHRDEVLLRLPGQQPVVIDRSDAETTFTTTC